MESVYGNKISSHEWRQAGIKNDMMKVSTKATNWALAIA